MYLCTPHVWHIHVVVNQGGHWNGTQIPTKAAKAPWVQFLMELL